jgi:signal transduction histidine kinase
MNCSYFCSGVSRDYGVVRIEDSGPGIPEEHRMKVFDRFYRLDAARARDTGGAGLGLSIAKWALEVQNGVVTVEDSAEGATFCIRLAAADGRSLSPSAPAAEQHHTGAKGLVSS